MSFLAHLRPCSACGGRLIFQHCNPCHRLYLHCERCELAYSDLQDPSSPILAALEHPTCPRCEGTASRPATRSDLENRNLLSLLES